MPVAPGSGTPAPRIAAAWQAAFADAAARGNLSADQIGYVIHDAGQGSEAASGRIRITSYNVCYTKLLRLRIASIFAR